MGEQTLTLTWEEAALADWWLETCPDEVMHVKDAAQSSPLAETRLRVGSYRATVNALRKLCRDGVFKLEWRGFYGLAYNEDTFHCLATLEEFRLATGVAKGVLTLAMDLEEQGTNYEQSFASDAVVYPSQLYGAGKALGITPGEILRASAERRGGQ